MAWRSHEEEASPLHAYLGDAQQSGSTRKRANLLAAAHVARALRQRQDVGDARRAGHGPEEHEEGTEPAGRAPGDDLVVLRQVGDEDADDDEAVGAGRQRPRGSLAMGWNLHRDAKVDHVRLGELPAPFVIRRQHGRGLCSCAAWRWREGDGELECEGWWPAVKWLVLYRLACDVASSVLSSPVAAGDGRGVCGRARRAQRCLG